MSTEQTAYVGDNIKVLVNVIDSTGSHAAAVINTSTTRLNGFSAVPTVNTISTGIYEVVFASVTPAPVEADRLICKINGTMGGVAWTEYGIPVKIVADERGTDSVVVPTSDIAAIKTKTDQFVFTVSNQVDANSLTGGLSEAQVRDAVGLASANLDTQLDNIPTSSEIATEILAAGDVDGYSLEETLKLCLAALAGKISGAGTGTITIRSADDTADRIVATTDLKGNRLSITIDEAG